MNLIKYLFIVLFVTPLMLSSCRKGEEDPFISFRSREKRLVGTWNLKRLSGSYEQQANGSYFTKTFGYDLKTDNILRVNDVVVGLMQITYYEDFYCYLDLYEDNSLKIRYRINGGPNWDEHGEWYWIDKGKRKEYIGMEGAFEFIYPFEHDFKIIRLAKDELKLEFDIYDVEKDENGDEIKLTGLFSYDFEKDTDD